MIFQSFWNIARSQPTLLALLSLSALACSSQPSTNGETQDTSETQENNGGAQDNGETQEHNDIDGSAGGMPGNTASPESGCSSPDLDWKTAHKTNYTSYPDPGSEECVEYNGCMWAGQFAACNDTKSEAWVSSHNIVAAFPDFDSLVLHDLCLRSGDRTLIVTVLDTCADSDCDGCCSENQGSAEQLIDLESYTNQRWGLEDGEIEWADLGPTTSGGCD